jgi:hypothetical protein
MDIRAIYLDLCRNFYPERTIFDFERDISFLNSRIGSPEKLNQRIDDSIAPEIKPKLKAAPLTAKQQAYIDYLCKRADLGQKDIRPMDIAEDMKCEAPYLLHCLGALHERGYLSREKQGHRKTILIPLIRSCGEKYAPPPKINGVTKLKPAYALGYEPFSTKI